MGRSTAPQLVGHMYASPRRDSAQKCHPWSGTKWVKGRPGRRKRLWVDWARAVAAALLFGDWSRERWPITRESTADRFFRELVASTVMLDVVLPTALDAFFWRIR